MSNNSSITFGLHVLIPLLNLQMTQITCLSHLTLQNFLFNSGPVIVEQIGNKSELICEGKF